MSEKPTISKAEIEEKILAYLTSGKCSDKHSIRHAIYHGGYPVIGVDDVFNALRRLERRGKVRVAKVKARGWYQRKLWEVAR